MTKVLRKTQIIDYLVDNHNGTNIRYKDLTIAALMCIGAIKDPSEYTQDMRGCYAANYNARRGYMRKSSIKEPRYISKYYNTLGQPRYEIIGTKKEVTPNETPLSKKFHDEGYKITEFRTDDDTRITLRPSGYYIVLGSEASDCPNEKGATLEYEMDRLDDLDNAVSIYSVERLSDGKVFSVGDSLHIIVGDQPSVDTIRKFTIKDNKCLVSVNDKFDQGYFSKLGVNLHSAKAATEPEIYNRKILKMKTESKPVNKSIEVEDKDRLINNLTKLVEDYTRQIESKQTDRYNEGYAAGLEVGRKKAEANMIKFLQK